MRWRIAVLVGLLVTAGIPFFFAQERIHKWPASEGQYVPDIYRADLHDRASIGTAEDPEARTKYLERMLIDPATGGIPGDIRVRETDFARRIRQKSEASASRKHALKWESAGPANVGGRTRALAVDVRNENIILAGGVSGGVWRSENGGRDWQKTTHPQSLHSVTCIVQNTKPGFEDHWYYGSGEIKGNSAARKGAPFRGDGIFHSTDNGRTWNRLPSTAMGVAEKFNSQFQYVSDLCFMPGHGPSGALYAACIGAVFRSVNGGISWTAVVGRDLRSEAGLDLNNTTLSRYASLTAADDQVIFALLSQEGIRGSSPERGVYRSANGTEWTSIAPFSWPARYGRGVMGASGGVPGVLYVYLNADEEMIWRYRYDAVTGRWDNLTANKPAFGGDVGDLNSQDSYNMVVAVHPADFNTVYLGGTNLYRSTDGFETVEQIAWIGGYDTANNVSKFANHFVDQHALVFMPSDPDHMLSSNDGGVFITRNNRAVMPDWQPLNTGYRTSQFFTLAVDEFGDASNVLGGLMDNGAYAVDAPVERSRWTSLLGGDGAYCAITRSGRFFYASTQNARIFRLTLNNALDYTTFARVDPVGGGTEVDQEYLFVNPFELAPENQNVMYLAGGDRIWRNDNLSQIPSFRNDPTPYNWTALPATRIATGQISALAVSVRPAGILYYGTTDGRLFRADSARAHDPDVTGLRDAAFPNGGYVGAIAVDPADAEHILVAFSNYGVRSIFASDDGGATFTHVGGNLEEFENGSGSGPSVRWVSVVPLENGRNLYFAGTSTGLYSTDDLQGSNTVWVNESPEGIGNVVVTMIKYQAHSRQIYAATHGNGVFSAFVEGAGAVLPAAGSDGFRVGPNYPNPMVNGTSIPYDIPADGMVRIAIHDYTGRLVRIILWAHQFAGSSLAHWDGSNEAGAPVKPGIYIARVNYEGQAKSIRIVVER